MHTIIKCSNLSENSDIFEMKHTLLHIAVLSIIFVNTCFAKESLVSLYADWQSLPVPQLMKMGEKFDLHNSSDSALVCYSIVADRLAGNVKNEDDSRFLARALNNQGYIYATFLFDYNKALVLFQESLAVSQKSNFASNIPYVYLNMGGAYLGCALMYGNRVFSDETWDYLDKALATGMRANEYEVALVAFLNMGQLYFEDPRKALLEEAICKLKTARIPHKEDLYSFTRRYADGLEAYIESDYQNAILCFQEAPELIPSAAMHRQRLELVALSALAEARREAGQQQNAIETAQTLLAKAKAIEASDEETRAYRLLAKLYEQTGNPDMANQCLVQYMQKKDSTLCERDLTMMSKMPLVKELDVIKAQLDEERVRKQRLIMITVISGLFIFMLALYLLTLIRSRKKMKSYVKDLYRKNIELMQSEKRERERREAENAARLAESATEDLVKYSGSGLTAAESRRIADRILEIMEDIPLITSPDFSLNSLAQITGCSYKYISQVVNETIGKNFRMLLNEYRIREACVRLLDKEQYGQYTIEHIAESVGFNSRSNFSVTFKKITGLTPAQFQKNALTEKD